MDWCVVVDKIGQFSSTGDGLKNFLALVVTSALILTGCAPSQDASNGTGIGSSAENPLPVEALGVFTQNASSAEEPLGAQLAVRASNNNEWTKACRAFKPRSTSGFGVVYDELIKDACSKAKPNSFKASAVVSPSVSARNVSRYMDSLRFHESYWSTRMNPGFTSPLRVVFSERDKRWWTQKQKQYLLKPDLGWFTSKSEGTHCRVMDDIFCPKHFEGALTKSGNPVEFRIIGSRLSWQNWQLTNGAHEAVHIYQDSHGQGHWMFWYIEGQATLFELAMGRLLHKSDVLRKMYLVDGPKQNDSLKINASSPESVAKFFVDCNNSGNACATFKYGGGSLFHEKLILDYGLDKYFQWQDYLNLNMSRGDQSKFTPAENEKLFKTFAKSFEEVFGITQERFETKVMPKYFFDSYREATR